MDCGNGWEFKENSDFWQFWYGLRGPAGPAGPPGSSVELRGPVASTSLLPESASSSELWMVGASSPYVGYFWNGAAWIEAGYILQGPQGEQGPAGADGAPGAAATVQSTEVVYQASASGTTVPSGSWSSSVPSVTQGEFLWTRTTVTFNTGSPVVWYAVAYQGEDGATPANYTGTLAAASWSGNAAPYSYALTVSGLLATDKPIVDVVMSGTYSTDEARNSAWAAVYRAVASADTLTVYASEKPTVDLPIQIQCVR